MVRDMMTRPDTRPVYTWPLVVDRDSSWDTVREMQQDCIMYRNEEKHSANRERQKNRELI